MQAICEKVQPFVQQLDTNCRRAIPTTKHVAVALHWLAHGASFRVLSSYFGIGKSTTVDISNQFNWVLSTHFLRVAVTMPSQRELEDQMAGSSELEFLS